MEDIATLPFVTDRVRRELDALTMEEFVGLYGPGTVTTIYWSGMGYWKQGDGRPALTFENNVAEAQAAGRCAANRTRHAGLIAGASIHPAPCQWCDYPKDVLLKALDHASFHSRYISTEYVAWPGKNGSSYARPTGRADTYENPTWAAFFAMPRELRRAAIEAAR